jgi:lysophospholipase L1-like esterase
MIGDSITEFADLPEICGRKPINAGLTGATTATFRASAKKFAEHSQPDFVVIALGTNDAIQKQGEGFRARFEELLSTLKKWKIIVVPVPPSPSVPDIDRFNKDIASLPVQMAANLERAETTDGVHLAASSYEVWKKNLLDAAQGSVCS